MSKRKYLLGYDPSFKTMGGALYNPETGSLILKTGTLQDVVKWTNENCKLSEVIAVVENPDLDKTTFGMWGMMQAKITSVLKGGGSMDECRSTFLIAMNHAQKVGKNKAAAQHIIQLLQTCNVPIIQVAPSKRDKAYKEHKTVKNGKVTKVKRRLDVMKLKVPTKTTQAQFQALTGYSKRSSDHARDAATLVHGRTMVWARSMSK